MDTLEQAKTIFLNGLEHQNRGQWIQAEASYRKALELAPNRPSVINNLAAVLLMSKRYDEAASWCEKLLALDPGSATALLNLANCRLGLKFPQAALDILDAALAINPDYAEALTSRGKALIELRRYEEAFASCGRALAVNPGLVDALNNRGVALLELNQPEPALADCDRALSIAPDFVRSLANRSLALRALGRYEEEARNYEKLLSVAPDYDYAPGNLFQARVYTCNWSGHDSMASRLKAGVQAGKRCCTPFVMIRASDSATDQRQCARIQATDKYPPSPSPLWTGERYPHDKIRIAYVSADFRVHPVAHLMAGLFEKHDRKQFEITAISFGLAIASDMRTRLERAFDHFVDVRLKSDAEVADLIRTLEIDVAVDLMGYTQDSRPGIFAMRPAPVQVNYLGFPGTMGADYIDYIIADRTVIPQEHQSSYTEKVVYLPETYLVTDSSQRIAEHTPSRADAGLPERGFVFCSFNASYKFAPLTFEVWMRLLRLVEGSVLWLPAVDAAAMHNLQRMAAKQGIAPHRLVFANRVTQHADHLARLRLADLFLDTLPYGAHTSAADALWAGLPVITCVGTTFAGRVAASLLHALGMPELIACTVWEYEVLALRLATEPDMLLALRAKLARNRLTHPLFDTDRFRRHLEAAYVTMWQTSQRGEPPSAFAVT